MHYLIANEYNLDFINPHLQNRYTNETFNTPNPYIALRLKLIDEASSKYLVGQVTSAISKPA